MTDTTHKAPLSRTAKRGLLRRLLGYILENAPLALLAVAVSLVSNYLALLGPRYLGRAIDAIQTDTGVQMPVVWQSFWGMLICYGCAAVLAYVQTLVMVTLGQRITYRMRRQLFEHLTALPVSYFDTHTTGDIVSRISYDIDTVNASLSTDLIQVLTSICTVLGSLWFMLKISRPLILVFAVTVPISLIFTRLKAKKIQPLFRARSRKLGELNGFAEEMLSGEQTIGAYQQAENMTARFDERNRAAVDAYYHAEYYGAMIGPSVNFINNLSLSLVMIFGGILYLYSQNGTVSAGSAWFITMGGVTQFVMYSRKFAGPINEFANIVNEFQSAFSAAERIFRIIDEAPEQPDAPDAETLADVQGNVALRNVSFGYTPARTVLHDLTLHAAPGQTIAVVGPTGAGKTTLINLLMRFYDVNAGEIDVDGHEIRQLTRSSLRGAYTMVLQDTWLFRGTVYDNIAYGRPDATPEEVVAAAKAAHIHSFIMHLPEGYQTMLADDGLNISKGQKQLITIARAMLPHTQMLILDEATSNVDSRTEQQIQAAMNELMRGRTCFVIAHRLSTVQHADCILVMQHGRVIEQGSHSELMTRGGFYASLYQSQFK